MKLTSRFLALLLFILVLLAVSQATFAQTTNPAVTQLNIGRTICVSGWSATVRPATTYTNGIKRKLLRQAGIPLATGSAYELDHRIPISSGGAPKDPANLALQPWDGPKGAKAKDAIELRVHKLICAGRITLATGQACFRNDWTRCP